MSDYNTFLLEWIAYRLTSGSREFADFRKHMEADYARTCEPSPSPVVRGDSRGGEKDAPLQQDGGQEPPAWRERLGLAPKKKEAKSPPGIRLLS